MLYEIILIVNIIIQWVGLHCRLGGCFATQPANGEGNEIKKIPLLCLFLHAFLTVVLSLAVEVHVKGLSRTETDHTHEDKI